MNKTGENSESEDSFCVTRIKKNAIIDSSEEECEDFQPHKSLENSELEDSLHEEEFRHHSNSSNEDSDLEDSLHKEFHPHTNISNEDSDPLDFLHEEISKQQNDESEHEDDIIESSDEEAENTEKIIKNGQIDTHKSSLLENIANGDISASDEEGYDTNLPSTKNEGTNSAQIANILQAMVNDSSSSDDELYYESKRDSKSSVELLEKSYSIVEVSSDEEPAPPKLKQTSIKSFMASSPIPRVKQEPQQIVVSHEEFQQQMNKIAVTEMELQRAKKAQKIINLQLLPDKGKSLLEKEKSLDVMLQEEKNKLKNMVVNNKDPLGVRQKVEVAWDEIEAGVNEVGPKTMGKKVVARFNAEKQLAVETLDHLHKSLDSCPTEKDLADDPKGVKVPLMNHQKSALAWLLWRERQNPSGGLLADDMGLGKTLTMISLILKSREVNPDEDSNKENYRNKYPGGTLVVCPASLMEQWAGEIERRTKRGLLSVELFHGPKRETKSKRLAQHDVVITTYGLILNDKSRVVYGVRWRRVILDEAHQIRNHKSQTAEAVFQISAKSRWALTGTPVHNKDLDMYAILKFLRCAPFDDLTVWKRWMSDKSTGGTMRLHAVISSLMLRRTKAELMEKGFLRSLPERNWELVTVKLDKDEMDVYQKVLIFSRALFAQFLHQRAEKSQDAVNLRYNQAPPDPNGEYSKMRNKLLKLNRVKEVSQHEILVLLLRLRQICCHPALISQMLQGDEDLGNADTYEDSEEMNLLDQLNKLNINEDNEHPAQGLTNESVGLKEASRGYLNPSNPVFRSERASSKIKKLVSVLKEKVKSGDKVVIVSQWTSLLDLIGTHVSDQGIAFDCLNGKIPTHKRMPIVDNFNDPKSDTRVLLLSLTAGGVGLNLVGANHLFLLDLHWNPQLESQAQDRIYRVGQTKPIFVYKFMAEDTIEERIKGLQDKKLEIAESMLTGSKRVADNKLSLQDLKTLFDFK